MPKTAGRDTASERDKLPVKPKTAEENLHKYRARQAASGEQREGTRRQGSGKKESWPGMEGAPAKKRPRQNAAGRKAAGGGDESAVGSGGIPTSPRNTQN